MVPPDSHGISRVPWYSGTSSAAIRFRIRGFHPLWRSFPATSATYSRIAYMEAPQPRLSEDSRFGLIPVRSPLLGESRLISSPPGTEMFHFPGFASRLLGIPGHDSRWVSPFGHPRIIACLAAPRGFSQPTTSFIASWRLGIHQSPLLS